jgi:hypothetical protein
MPDQSQQPCINARPSTQAGDAVTGAPLTADQLQRWAALIAEGLDELPSELSPADQKRLVDEVRRLLRQQLMNFVAGAIARSIARQQCHDKEVERDQA